MSDLDRIKELEGQLTESQNSVKALENQQVKSEKVINRLKNQLAELQSSKPGDKAKALKMSQGSLKKALEAQLDKARDKISNLLIRAKNVTGKGLKIQTRITMKNSDDDKAKDALTEKLESLIRESGDGFSQVIVSITPVKGKETRVSINIV
jgi:septal ring factor EnvC (AmiA/AmiB activator)